MRLKLHPDKTLIVELGLGTDGFNFLGCYLRLVQSHRRGRAYLFRWRSRKVMKKVRDRVRELTDRRRRAAMREIRALIRDLNPVLRGWGHYFRTGNASLKLQEIDRHLTGRLARLLERRCGARKRKQPFRRDERPRERLVKAHGVHRLLGTIRYPGGPKAA
ncbi:MAG: group II intron maturase-specific domain-containing protein [Thermoanaerobaculia bacterium]